MLDVRKLFERAITHFRSRERAVRSLAVTAAMERWVQFEFITLLDAHREDLGISGLQADGLPRWWIACEHDNHDLWVADHGMGYSTEALHGVSIELKAVHNNKNYEGKVASIRADLTPSRRILPKTTVSVPHRWGVIVATYVLYSENSESTYAPLHEARRLVDAPRFWARLTNDLEEDAPKAWGALTPLEVVSSESIADLTTAHYVDPTAKSCEVKLLLVKPRSDI